MRDINLNNLTRKDLMDHDAISEAFKKYLMDVLGDFENPYDTPFILQDYEGDYTVDGKEYEVRSCHTDFCYCGLFHLADKEPFEFYMFFDRETMSDNTVGSYQNATKLYLI
jgi:hypothetical protein